jgi:hypothetical protein
MIPKIIMVCININHPQMAAAPIAVPGWLGGAAGTAQATGDGDGISPRNGTFIVD